MVLLLLLLLGLVRFWAPARVCWHRPTRPPPPRPGWLQREPEVRRFLLRYHIPTLVQLAIIAYVASGWQYFRKVRSGTIW